jgi:hypothetical protein
MPVGKCANCDAAVSYFARVCPRCGLTNQPNAVTTGTALVLLAVFGLGLFFFVAGPLLWERAAPRKDSETQTDTVADQNYGWLVQAMADCEVYAKQYPDTLYFLLMPLTPTGKRLLGWEPTPSGQIGRTAMLVSSTDALIGLRNGVFQISRQTLTFAVRDPDSQTVYKWKPTSGVSELKAHDSGFSQLALGLQIGDQGELDWGPSFRIVKGNCYWTYPVIGAPPGSPLAPPQ